jgi:hypothetical protein
VDLITLILLGAWGGLLPFVGPYFGYACTPATAWHFTLARLWLRSCRAPPPSSAACSSR